MAHRQARTALPEPPGSGLLGGELRARVRLQEAARRTAKGPHRNALVRRDLRALPEGLLRRPLDPCADHALGTLRFEGEPLHHLAVALGAPIRFRAHA